MSLYGQVGRLRAEISKWREAAKASEMKCKELEERLKRAEDLIASQATASSEVAQENLNASEVRRKQMEEALKRAEEFIKSRARVRALASRVNAAMADKRAGGGGAMQRLVQQRTPRNQTGLTRGAPRARRSAAITW